MYAIKDTVIFAHTMMVYIESGVVVPLIFNLGC